MTDHGTIAARLAADARHELDAGSRSSHPCVVPTATRDARQGDLLLMRIGDATINGKAATDSGGVCLVAGDHGEHRLVADDFTRHSEDTFSISGGLLVHTDERPGERHGAIALGAGQWRYCRQRELHGKEIVPVQD